MNTSSIAQNTSKNTFQTSPIKFISTQFNLSPTNNTTSQWKREENLSKLDTFKSFYQFPPIHQPINHISLIFVLTNYALVKKVEIKKGIHAPKSKITFPYYTYCYQTYLAQNLRFSNYLKLNQFTISQILLGQQKLSRKNTFLYQKYLIISFKPSQEMVICFINHQYQTTFIRTWLHYARGCHQKLLQVSECVKREKCSFNTINFRLRAKDPTLSKILTLYLYLIEMQSKLLCLVLINKLLFYKFYWYYISQKYFTVLNRVLFAFLQVRKKLQNFQNLYLYLMAQFLLQKMDSM
eukprot:TRINITY_DN12088_c0_g3_i1.p1 TRINITY_DN12088_c0_g3~~TRINITY_DN12088_c0_g3_i1.p1  ORF type:complete len:323 (-),score=-28.41 TRINITY_DN12088_c0_g3_i1:784-1665(-)